MRQFLARFLSARVSGSYHTREVNVMPREAKLLLSSAGSAARGFLRFRANIPPRWIKNAHKSRKRIGPEIVDALRSRRTIQRNRPRAQVALKNSSKQLKAILSRWETAYNKRISTAGYAFFSSYSDRALRSCNGTDYFKCLLTALAI
jgi:hypothetical protein